MNRESETKENAGNRDTGDAGQESMTGTHEPNKQPSWQAAIICLALAGIAFAVFGQTLRFGFINYDDGEYVYNNALIKSGLSWQGVDRAFTHVHASNWHPLTTLSHMLDCSLYGLNPAGHHLTNVVLHSLSAIILFLALREMTGTPWRSAFVAAVFAVHPLHVQSVAWVAERKDALSGLFFMLTLWTYAGYARAPQSVIRYVAALLLAAMGLMSKPMLVTLPFVLLLLDYWPLGRWNATAPASSGRNSRIRLVLEKVPFLALSAGVCIATLVAQKNAIQPTIAFSISSRVANGLISCAVYLRQTFFPWRLAVFYPFPKGGFQLWETAGAFSLLAAISVLVFLQRRKSPWLLAGWLWYLGMLVPVIGLVQVGGQAHADRYTYLPMIGILLAVTWALAEWRPALHLTNPQLGGVSAGVIVLLLLMANAETSYWRNSESLWTHALADTSPNVTAYDNLGLAQLEAGKVEEGLKSFHQALECQPQDAAARNDFARALLQNGQADEAVKQFQIAMQLQPDLAYIHKNLGGALIQQGRLDEARQQYQVALNLKADYPEAHNDLGVLLRRLGRADEAIAEFQAALRSSPDYAEAHGNLGNALLQKDHSDDAILQLRMALKINPDLADVQSDLGVALLQKHQTDAAIASFQKALQIKPSLPEAHLNLGNIYLHSGHADRARLHFEETIKVQPDNVAAINNLAWILATAPIDALRNGARARDLALQANQLSGGTNPIVLHTLAAACAENGQFPEALEYGELALKAAELQSNTALAEAVKAELASYQAARPIRDGSLNSPAPPT